MYVYSILDFSIIKKNNTNLIGIETFWTAVVFWTDMANSGVKSETTVLLWLISGGHINKPTSRTKTAPPDSSKAFGLFWSR